MWVLLAVLLFAAKTAQGDTSGTPLLTWRAVSFTPSFYAGRALPISGTKIIAAVDMIDGGKPVSLSNQTIYWYLNDQFISGGVGLTRFAFTIPEGVLANIQVRAALPNYQDGIAKTVVIPVTVPQAVIESPVTDRKIRTQSFSLKAWPYFFNVKSTADLNFKWLFDGQEPVAGQTPDRLDVSVAPGTAKGTVLPVSLRIVNPATSFEFGNKEASFTFDP
jgi:hypothetical protein